MEAYPSPSDWELRVLGFEQRLRQLNNRRIQAVRYYEIDYQSESAAWSYRPEHDSLDFGLALELDNGDQFYIQWGQLFTQYCLSFEPAKNWDYHKVWDVSRTSRWSDLLNVEIVATQVFWRETPSHAGGYHHYPQDLGITFANGRQVYASAVEIREKNFDYRRVDHITVFFDRETALNYGIGPWA